MNDDDQDTFEIVDYMDRYGLRRSPAVKGFAWGIADMVKRLKADGVEFPTTALRDQPKRLPNFHIPLSLYPGTTELHIVKHRQPRAVDEILFVGSHLLTQGPGK